MSSPFDFTSLHTEFDALDAESCSVSSTLKALNSVRDILNATKNTQLLTPRVLNTIRTAFETSQNTLTTVQTRLSAALDTIQTAQETLRRLDFFTAGLYDDLFTGIENSDVDASPRTQIYKVVPIRFHAPHSCHRTLGLAPVEDRQFPPYSPFHDQTFDFLQLCSDLRSVFYNYLLREPPSFTDLISEFGTDTKILLVQPLPKGVPGRLRRLRFTSVLHLRQTCKKINEELQPLLFRRKTVFRSVKPIYDRQSESIWSQLFLLRSLPLFQHQIRHLELEIEFTQLPWEYHDLRIHVFSQTIRQVTSFVVDYLNRRRCPNDPRQHHHMESLTIVLLPRQSCGREDLYSRKHNGWEMSRIQRYEDNWQAVVPRTQLWSAPDSVVNLFFQNGLFLKRKFPGYEVWAAALDKNCACDCFGQALMIRLTRSS